MRRNTIKISMAVGDYLILFASLAVVLAVRYGAAEFPREIERHIEPFAMVFGLWIAVLYILDLYNISAPFNHRNYVTAMLANIGVAVGFFYIVPRLDITPKTNLVFVAGVFTLLFYGWRFAFTRIIGSFGLLRWVAIVGCDKHSLELARKIQQNRRLGFRVAVMVCGKDQSVPGWVKTDGIRVLDTVTDLHAVIRELHISTVVVSDAWFNAVHGDLYTLLPYRLSFYQLTTFWERFDETIPIYSTRETWFLENFNRGPNRGYHLLKRFFDVFFAVLLAPLFIALSIPVALAIKLTSKGPALFSQTRVGRNDVPFTLYKFRSMRTDAERDGAQWAQKNDPRITPVGRFLRRTRLDELPQLWNVLTGEMSWIGPRPERPEFVRDLTKTIPHYHLRHLVKPGLTGWAQVKYEYAASAEDAATKLTYDLYYVKNLSIVLDIKILLKTVMIVLGAHGR